jgi:hypothetical protein
LFLPAPCEQTHQVAEDDGAAEDAEPSGIGEAEELAEQVGIRAGALSQAYEDVE